MRTQSVSRHAVFYSLLAISIAASPSPAQAGPYPPAAGYAGAVAISATSSSIAEWASGDTLTRGLVNVTSASSGTAYYGGTSGTPANNAPIGMPPQPQSTAYGVALGQGGSATITFNTPIANGPGYDFAVFGNGFSVSSTAEWVKPAFVEVSSDGTNFFSFPSVSLTPTATQVGNYGTLDPTNLYDLAGKDPAGWGTPFDLSELAGVSPDLNINDIIAVRIVDAVGDINAPYATYDSQGNIVNGPWPAYSAAGSEGFVLAGVGVLNVAPEPGSGVLTVTSFILIGAYVLRRYFLQYHHKLFHKESTMLRNLFTVSHATKIFTLALILSTGGLLFAQTPVATITNLPPPDANAYGTSFRYSSTGQLYAWDGLSVWTLSGSTFTTIGSAPSGNSSDAGPINFSQNGQTVVLSNGAGGAQGGSYNGQFFSMPSTGGSATQLSGTVPYTGDFIPLPAASGIASSATKLLVNAGNASYDSSTVSVLDVSSGSYVPVITGGPGATTSLAFNPANGRLYAGVGYGPDQGNIYSFSIAQIDAAFNSNTPIDFSAGTLFNTGGYTGSEQPTSGSGMFFDSHGYLFSGGDGGITVFSPGGALVNQVDPNDFTSLTYNPATDQFLDVDANFPPNTGVVYQAADLEVTPEPGTLVLVATFVMLAAITASAHKLRLFLPGR
jgi:hypothetical protein